MRFHDDSSADPAGTAEKELLDFKLGQSQWIDEGFKLLPQPHEHKKTTSVGDRGLQITNFVTTSFMDDPLVSGESVVVTLVDRDS